jgi:uncharacterized membrane protein HdeD (DUF308 family)
VTSPRQSQPPKRRSRLLRRNSIPLTLHGLLEYGLGVLAIAAPFLFSFDSNTAVGVWVLLGGAIIVLAALTDSPTGIVRSLPVDSHVVLDFVIAIASIMAPFLLGFSDETGPTAFSLLFGIGFLALALMTRYHHEPK